jgi:hypothetical protein
MTPDDNSGSIPCEEALWRFLLRPRTVTAPDLVISQREAVPFLVMSAREYAATPCEDTHCEACYEFVYAWKSVYQALGATYRAAVEAGLEHADIRAPAFPQGLL